MATSSFEIKGRPKVRSLAGAAGLSVLGMLVMVLSGTFGWGSTGLTVGVVLAALGIGLVLMTQEAARKSGVTALLSDDGFVLTSSRGRCALAWGQVKRVSMAGNTLIVRDDKGQEVQVVAPPGSRPEELDALAAALAKRLDTSRGYGRKA